MTLQMSKAAAREVLKNEDFVQLSNFRGGQVSLQPPVVPSLITEGASGMDDEDEVDDGTKVQPISISLLKDYMQKRIQKSLSKKSPHGSSSPSPPTVKKHDSPESPHHANV